MTTPCRIQRKRTKGWRMPENTIYVGRPGRWGNPFDFRNPDFCWVAISFNCRGNAAGRHEASVKAYRYWINPGAGRRTMAAEYGFKIGDIDLGPSAKAEEAPSIETIKNHLAGKNLACFCRLDQPCHADVLLEIANATEPPI